MTRRLKKYACNHTFVHQDKLTVSYTGPGYIPSLTNKEGQQGFCLNACKGTAWLITYDLYKESAAAFGSWIRRRFHMLLHLRFYDFLFITS